MKTVLALGLTMALGAAMAQKQPQIKSQKEGEAWQAVVSAADPDGRIKAVEDLLTKFADTELKVYALQIAMESAQEKNDFERTIIYAERTLEADPKNFSAMLAIARNTAQRTREFDLDKEEKLTRADKFAKDAIETLKTAVKPNPQITDEQWSGFQKDLTAQGYEALGMSAMVRKKHDDAITQFQTAASMAMPESAQIIKVRLAAAYNGAGKHDDAVKVLDALLADQSLNPNVRQVAGQEKLKAVTAKAKK